MMFCHSELELSTLIQLLQFFFISVESSMERNFPKKASFFSLCMGLVAEHSLRTTWTLPKLYGSWAELPGSTAQRREWDPNPRKGTVDFNVKQTWNISCQFNKLKQNIPTSEMSKCFTLIQKMSKQNTETFLNMIDIIPGNNFSYFFAPVCSVPKNKNSKIHKAVLKAIYHRRDQYCLYMHECVSTLTPTHTTSTEPFSGTPRTPSGLVSPPKSCQASSPMTRECPSVFAQETLKTECLGLAKPSLTSPHGSHTTQFRVPLLSSRVDPGFGLPNFRPHSLVLMWITRNWFE